MLNMQPAVAGLSVMDFNLCVYVLPNHVVSANTTNVFKNRLDKFWHDQEIIYDFNAQLEGTGSRSAVE